MTQIRIKEDGSFAAVASTDPTQHPYYKAALQILHQRGLSPRGTRGHVELEKLLADYDLAPPKAKPNTSSNFAVARYQVDLARAKVKLREAEDALEEFTDSLNGELDIDVSTIKSPKEAIRVAGIQTDAEDLARTVAEYRQRVEGFKLAIRRQAAIKHK